jgi:hypothetical protein
MSNLDLSALTVGGNRPVLRHRRRCRRADGCQPLDGAAVDHQRCPRRPQVAVRWPTGSRRRPGERRGAGDAGEALTGGGGGRWPPPGG